MGKITRPIQQSVGFNMLAIPVFSSIDIGSDPWQTGYQVECIIKSRIPIIFLVHAGCIGFGKMAAILQGHDGHYKHGHWMG